MWKPQPDACVQQGPHFSTQGKNNSWQEVIFPCRPQQVTGIATYLHEHTSNMRSILSCPKSGQVCLKQQAVQFCKDLCTRVYIKTVVVLFVVRCICEVDHSRCSQDRTDASNAQYSRSAAALEANRRRGSCTHLECQPVYSTPASVCNQAGPISQMCRFQMPMAWALAGCCSTLYYNYSQYSAVEIPHRGSITGQQWRMA